MAQLPVLTAVSGVWEAPLVSALEAAAGDVVVVRRCVDLTDLLAAAASGRARAAVLSADLRGLDRDALARLSACGVAVVALVAPGATDQWERMLALAAGPVLPADAPVAQVQAALAAAVATLENIVGRRSVAAASDPGAGAAADTAAGPWASGYATRERVDSSPSRSGRLIAVWGPVGSPGRTTVAVTLAAELAAAGDATLLADADTYGACVAQTLGVLDEAPGLAAACRAATAGNLDAAMLARLAPVVSPGLRVLTGITRADRWPELSVTGLERVWDVVRQVSVWTVVDTGFSLERDEELAYDTMAPRRNGATLSALEAADVVLAVGTADPVGLQRLVRGLGELAEVLPHVQARVVVTRARTSAVGAAPERRVREALERYAAVRDVVVVPDDRPAVDAGLLAGRTLTESAPGSPARRAVAELASSLAGRAGAGAASRRSRRKRRAG